MAVAGEPILSRIDRLDRMLKQLEDIRGGGGGGGARDDVHHSLAKNSVSSEPSTPSSATDGVGAASSVSSDFSPRSLQKHCRPIDSVIMEAESKGTLIERLDHIEDRLLKMEEELKAERQEEDRRMTTESDEKGTRKTKKKKKKGLRQMVKGLLKSGGEDTKNPSPPY